jgi:hypothetical protein
MQVGAYSGVVFYFEITYFEASTGAAFGSGIGLGDYESGWYYTSRFC